MPVEASSDPFLASRDRLEQAADEVVREYFVAQLPHGVVHRRSPHGYALVAPQHSGARTLTVPAANEADFMFHGNAGESGNDLADFIAQTIRDTGVDHLRLPLLSRDEAIFLRQRLAERLPDWYFAEAMSSLSPICRRKPGRLPESFRRAIARAERAGVVFEQSRQFEMGEAQRLHQLRWGPGSRGPSFFGMLERLVEAGCAEYLTARDQNGNLRGAQLDIIGSKTRHFYYSVSDRSDAAGLGTAVMGISWSRYIDRVGQSEYSFGRGSERYKYRYADDVRIWFELRGFFAPVQMAA